MSTEIVTKNNIVENDDMKTNEIVEALDRIGRDTETLIERGVSPQEIETIMSTLGDKLTVKISGAMNILSKYESLAFAAKQRAQAISDVASSYQRKAQNLREYLKYAMSASGTKKIEGEFYSITYSKTENGSVDIFDEKQVPESFHRVKTIVEMDKIKIKDAIKSGETVSGARMLPTEKIIIKGI